MEIHPLKAVFDLRKKAALASSKYLNSQSIQANCATIFLQPIKLQERSSFFWARRGIIIYIIAEGKCIDNEVISNKCRQCDLWEKKKGTEEYEKWKETHDSFCSMNHQGSSGAMEVTGLKQIYHRSVKNPKLRYKFHIGDDHNIGQY